MDIPEGLHVESTETPGELVVVDAQEHVWLTLHDGAEGDPVEWRQSILNRVSASLALNDEPLHLERSDSDDQIRSHVVLRVDFATPNDYYMTKQVDQMVEFLDAFGAVTIVEEHFEPGGRTDD